MKTRIRYVYADQSRMKRPPPGRASAMARGANRGRRQLREHSNLRPHERIADSDATLSLFDAIDLLRVDIHRTARFIYSDLDEP